MKTSVFTKGSELDSLLDGSDREGFVFRFHVLSESENSYWQERMRRNHSACGCGTGGMFAAISTLVFALFIGYASISGGIALSMVVGGLVSIIAMAAIGKTVGKKMALRSLRRDVFALKSKLQ